MASSRPRDLPERPATSADVAKRAGVSRATVSYILNNKPGMSFTDQTRATVLQAAADLHYRPNLAARSLVRGGGPIVMVMSHLPANEMTAHATSALTLAFARRGIISTIVQVGGDLDSTVQSIVGLNPSAVLLAFPVTGDLGQRLLAEGAKVISLVASSPFPLSTGHLQVEHLAAVGHRRIAFADVVNSTEFGVLPRRAEVRAACSAAGLPDPLAAEVARNGEGARETIEAWHREGVTAVAAYNDEVALAVLHGIREAGLSCPSDMAVIGCDDIPAASVAYPPLSTISVDLTTVEWVVGSVLHALNLTDTAPTAVAPPLSARRRATT